MYTNTHSPEQNKQQKTSKQINKKASSQNPPVQERFLRMTLPQKVVLPCKQIRMIMPKIERKKKKERKKEKRKKERRKKEKRKKERKKKKRNEKRKKKKLSVTVSCDVCNACVYECILWVSIIVQ